MIINSIQNRNIDRTNFGCNFCKATEVLLERYGKKEVSNILSRVNPENPIDAYTCTAMQKAGITPFDLHLDRAEMIYTSFMEIIKADAMDHIKPSKIEDLVIAFREMIDNRIALRIGENFGDL